MERTTGTETARAADDELSRLTSFDYTLFENVHRGSFESIKERLRPYLAWFDGADGVVDIGCGRGEMLELLNENGISTKGVDLNDEMVSECQRRGFTAEKADALSFLDEQDGRLPRRHIGYPVCRASLCRGYDPFFPDRL